MQSGKFIVIEGLDGSGKSSLARNLVGCLNEGLETPIARFSFEPNDHHCGGGYIRSVLRKEITAFSPESLMYAFVANRLDHGHRVISPWLDGHPGHILICDRYYLSSLVYQSNDQYGMEYVMCLNRHARRPDLTIFLEVSDEICYERMGIRNKPRELFEENFSLTRKKYQAAIEFLRQNRNERIISVDASGTPEDVLGVVMGLLGHEYRD